MESIACLKDELFHQRKNEAPSKVKIIEGSHTGL
jgi:hypothetical protein